MTNLSRILLLAFTIALSGTFAPIFTPGSSSSGSLTIAEEDGNPSSTFTTLKFANGSLTNNGDGTASVANITAESDTLDTVFDRGKTIDGANSLANAVRIGDGTTPICLYTDATFGPTIIPCTAANTKTMILTNFTWSLYDQEGDCNVETVDPDAASPFAVWSYTCTATRPLKSVWIGAGAMSTDGTNCAAPTEATPLASGVKLYTIICGDNDSSRMHFSFVMPDSYNGGTVTLESAVVQTAADTNVIEFQAAMQCKGDTETLVTTANYGAEVVWTDTMTGSSGINHATSGAITPAGTCAAGDFVAGYIDIGATNTTTAMATAHIIGFKMEYTITSRSD